VTPNATAATMSKKKTAPKRVTHVLLLASESENKPKNDEPAGSVAATKKIEEQVKRDQPAMYPRAGCSPRRTHAYVAPAFDSVRPR